MLFWKGLTGKMLSVQTYNKCTCNFEFNFSFVQKVGAKSMFWRQKIRLYAMYFIFMCSGPKSNKVVKDILRVNPLSNNKFFYSSKVKGFPDDNFKFDANGRKFSKRVENTVGKGEIAHYEKFLLFPPCF